MIRDAITGAVDAEMGKIWDLAQWLYEHPETSLQEVQSAAKIASFLRDAGFVVEERLKGMETAFRAVKKKGRGPNIGFIAEYDALPGIGHACGHHLISAMSVGAAVALSDALEQYPGSISVIGTPSEETGHGKPYLVEHGVFKGMDAALMIHPHGQTCLYPEIIAIGGLDFFFTGKAAHAGADPHNGINALDAVVLLYTAVNALRQQLRDGTRVHGIILEAGTAANSIPDAGKVRLEFRAKEQEYFDEVVCKVIRCAEGAALATGCSLHYEHFEPTCRGMIANTALGDIFKGHMDDFGIAEDWENVLLGSTDMGNVSYVVPSIHPLLKMTEKGEQLHTPEFLRASLTPFARERTAIGAKLLALTGLSLLQNPELARQLRDKGETRP